MDTRYTPPSCLFVTGTLAQAAGLSGSGVASAPAQKINEAKISAETTRKPILKSPRNLGKKNIGKSRDKDKRKNIDIDVNIETCLEKSTKSRGEKHRRK